MNIRSSMYRLVIILVIVPFLVFSSLLSFTYSTKLKKVIQESLEAVANSQLAEMSDFCELQRNNLNILGSMKVTRTALHGELNQDMLQYLDNILDSYAQATPYLNCVALLDTDYRLVACSTQDYAPFANPGFDMLIERMKGNPFYISNVLTYERYGQEVQSVVAIAKITDGETSLGYALSEINLDFYDNIRRQAKLWNESTFYLLDGKQNIISAGTQEDRRESFVTTDTERKDYHEKYDAIDFKKYPKGSFNYQVDGNTYITYYSNVGYTDWRVLLSVNMDLFLNKGQVSFLFIGTLVLLCAISTLLLERFMYKRIVWPIQHISDTLDGIQQKQDYSLRIRAVRKDELGTLSEKINELLSFIETENLYKAKQERLLREKAERDALTHVLNAENIREYLHGAISRHQSDGSPMAVLFVDVDDFKAFNTNYGHSVGDQALLYIASVLAHETGGIVGRIGGDEFLTIIENQERLAMLESCLEWVNDPARSQFVLRGSGEVLPIACSIGVVFVDFNGSCPEEITAERLENLADAAMYEAKNNGKCGYIIKRCPPYENRK